MSHPSLTRPILARSLSAALAVTLTFASRSHGASQTWDGGSSGGGTGWLTGTNWVGDPTNANVPGSKTVQTNVDTGTFDAAGSSATIGIALAGANYYLGAINLQTGTRNVGNSSAAGGTLQLNGATLNTVSNVILRNADAGTLTIQAQQTGTMGVTLGNATDNVVLIESTGGVTVSSIIGGASRHLSLSGGGTGLLTLSAANTYSGGTTVAAGQLRVTNTTGSATGAGGVTVGNNTGVAVMSGTGLVSGLVTTATTWANVAHLAPGLNPGSALFGAAGTLQLHGGLTIGTDSALNFDLASTTATGNDLITLGGGTLSLASAFTINYRLFTPEALATTGSYTLLSGAANTVDLSGISITSVGLGDFTPTYSMTGGALQVSFANPNAATPNYFDTNGATAGIGLNGGDALWDTTTTNWNPVAAGNGTPKVFQPAGTVYFGASGGGTAGSVSVDAAGVTANNGVQFDVSGYVLTGGVLTLGGSTPTVTVATAGHTATLNLTVSGTTGFNKAGAGTLVLGDANDFTGPIGLQGGVLSIVSDSNLGVGTNDLVFNGGTLRTTTGVGTSRKFTVTAGGAGGTYDTNGFDSSTSGTTTIDATFTKAGAGGLSLDGNVFFGANGTLNVAAGTLTFGQLPGPGIFTSITMFAGAVLNGHLAVKNDLRLNLNGAYTGSGQIQIQTAFSDLATTGSGVSATIGNDIVLNSLGLTGVFATNLSPVSNGSITVNGVISGDSELNFAGGGPSGGSGTLTLNAVNTYLRATTVNLSTTGVVKLGIANALPTGTDLSFNTLSGATGGTLDLNGHPQTVASLAYANVASTATASNFKITNSGTADATFTVSGAGTPANGFAGVLADGATHKLALVKAGAGGLTLTGVNTFTGGTTIEGGLLAVNANAALGGPAAPVAIHNLATLQATGPVSIAARTLTLGGGGGKIDTNGQTVTFAPGSTITGGVGDVLEKIGAGTLVLAGTQNYRTLTTTAGVTEVDSPLPGGATVNANATTNFSTSQTLSALHIGAGAVVTLEAAPGFSAGLAVVPEPASLGLFALGALALLGRRRRA